MTYESLDLRPFDLVSDNAPLFIKIALATPIRIILTNAVVLIITTRRPSDFPPGPSGIPGLGNLLQIDKKFPFQTYSAWYKKYGKDSPVGFKAANNNLVVLNRARLVHETFDKRGAVYSDRPYLYINNEWITGHDLKFVLTVNPGPWVTKWRKRLSYMLNRATLTKLNPAYEAEAARFVVQVLEAGAKVKGEGMANLLLSYILSIQYLGLCAKRPENLGGNLANIQDLRYAQQDWISMVTRGAGDLFPPFRYLPPALAPWKIKTTARKVRDGIIARIDWVLEAAREPRAALDAGSPAWENLLAKMLREQREEENPYFTDSDIGMTAVKSKVRKEMLEVTGGKAPQGEHIPKLHSFDGALPRLKRLRIPRQMMNTSKATTPQRKCCSANVWHIHHNETDFDAPDEYIPGLWLTHSFSIRQHNLAEQYATKLESSGRRKTYAFGAGRRMCPGYESAKKNLLLGMAKSLWAFDVFPPEGREIDLSMETGYLSDLALRPKNTDVTVTLHKRITKQDVYNHYYDSYKGEVEVFGWKKNEYR